MVPLNINIIPQGQNPNYVTVCGQRNFPDKNCDPTTKVIVAWSDGDTRSYGEGDHPISGKNKLM